jgi:hypothetical protein
MSYTFVDLPASRFSCLQITENRGFVKGMSIGFSSFKPDGKTSDLADQKGLSTISKILIPTDDLWRSRTSGRATDHRVRFFGCAPGIMHSR